MTKNQITQSAPVVFGAPEGLGTIGGLYQVGNLALDMNILLMWWDIQT